MKQWVGKGRSCFEKSKSGGEEEFEAFNQCRQQVLAGWAVGGQGTIYPENIGFPLYNDAKDMYVMMEMHYDNSQFKKGIYCSYLLYLYQYTTVYSIYSI